MDNYKSINFEIFKSSDPELAEFCIFAEKYLYQDPITSLMKIRQFGELLAKELAASLGLYTNPREFQYNLLVNLEKKGIIRPNISTLFHQIRIAGNKANHEMSGNSLAEQHEKNYRIALKQLKNSHKLCIWYLKFNKKYTQDIPDFIEPVKPISVTVQESAVELKQLDDNYQTLLSEIQKIQEQPKDTDKINKTILIAQNKAEEIKLESSEFETQSSNINLLPIGTILNNQYKIIEILSAGSFGQTYLANDTNCFDEKIVIKQFRPQSSDEETIKSAKILFKKEAQALYKLNKVDGIPNLKAFFEEDNQFYLVQEFIDGNTLEEEIMLGNKFSESEVTKLLQNILSSLNNLHSLSVIHRDIKPSNLIRNVNNKKIYLIDFGAVKEIVNNSTDGTIIIGTKGYMPFEQLQGYPQLNSDIYAVGMIAIQAATGLKISKINESQWQTEANHLSDNLICILEKMTAIDYNNRYRYVQEILDDLKNQESTSVSSEPIISAVVSPITEIKYIPQPINNINTVELGSIAPFANSSTELEPESKSVESKPELNLELVKTKESKLVKPPLGLTIAGVVVGIAVLGFLIKSIPYFTKAKISIDTITIDTLEKPKKSTELRKHLETELIPSNYVEMYKEADAQLNAAYQRLTYIISPERKAKLTQAQLAWIQFRDNQCLFEWSEAGRAGGNSSQGVIARYTCLKGWTEKRTNDFNQYIQSQLPKPSRNGSLKELERGLNIGYELLNTNLSGEVRNNLKAAQSSWSVYRNLNCQFEATFAAIGQDLCLRRMTQERVDWLPAD